MVSLVEILSPSYLLFPALLGSAILALVCPLVGAHLILRHRVFLGLTLPQVAACGVAFTFWVYHEAGATHGAGGERLLAMAGSLVFTLAGMGVLAYLDRHATGSPEGRLAAAYALASALTILFVVFNPAGELEIVNLLKGEMIALSQQELKLLAFVYGAVLLGLVLFRREFLLNSFDRDLAFLLTGNVQWSFWLYVLCGITIAVGVIMAGPLLVFGFMVLPPLAARGLARGMGSYFTLSSLLGLLTAILGFFFAVRLDLPLGPTDVALGCAVIFIIHAGQFLLRKTRAWACLWVIIPIALAGCGASKPQPELDLQSVERQTIWLATVRNGTATDLRLPGTNPLRSLAEMAGRLDPEYRPTVMDLLRDTLKRELEERGSAVAFPELQDMRLSLFPFDADDAARGARAAKLSGYLWLTEIRRWDGDPRGLLRTWVEFKLVRIDDGATAWHRRVQKTQFSPGARADQSAADAVSEILREALGS